MSELGMGAGLAALGFWLFVATMIAAGVWDNIRKRESQHETLRRIVESGQTVDDSLTDKILSLSGSRDLARDLKVSGLITVFIAPGVLVLGWALSFLSAAAFKVLMGVAGLIVFISAGLLLAAFVVEKWYQDDDPSGRRSRAK